MSQRTPYTYCLFHIPTGLKYYGAKWGQSADPSNFWKTYFTSSATVKKMIEVYGADSFVPQVRQIFREGTEQERIQKCISWEHRVLERILGHPRWINRFIGSETRDPEIQKQLGQNRIAHEKLVHGEAGFRLLQQQRGVLAGQQTLTRGASWLKQWHSAGAAASHEKRKKLRSQLGYDPFLTEEGRQKMSNTCSKTFKNSIELWDPAATATNKRQPDYVKGQCVRCKVDSDRYHELMNQGFITIQEHMKRLGKMSPKEYKKLTPDEKLARRQQGWDKMRTSSPEQREKILHLKQAGKKWREISREVGLPEWYCLRQWQRLTCL